MPSFLRKPYQKKTFVRKPKIANPLQTITRALKAKERPQAISSGLKLPRL